MAGTEGEPLLVVVSGPSGVGKDTLLERLAARNHGMQFHFVVTATTRTPRPGELWGVNHHFVDRRGFERMIAAGELLEWAEVYGNYYGVPKGQVRQALNARKHVLCRVDVQGARRLRAVTPDAVFVFVLPPTLKALEMRLRARGKDSQESIQTRLAAAASEIEEARLFDYRIVNREGALDGAVLELIDIIHRESTRTPPRTVRV
ncbi:MAG: guanylate kinase [Chloroflexi bacterium]|nr:guanylate kinase [Chloroflexota bacterium]